MPAIPATEDRTTTRIARVMSIRARDTAAGLDRARRAARCDELLARLRARILAPRLSRIVADIERAKGWSAHLGALSGRDREEAKAEWARIEDLARQASALLALVKGETPRIDEVAPVLEEAA
jgi:hypothetical protein